MSWSKKATVTYHFIESANEDFFSDFKNAMDALLGSREAFGSFESGETHFSWEILSNEHITDSDTYFVSLVKRRDAWPVWVNEEGQVSEIPLDNGFLGELYYALINPANKFILSMAAATGSASGSFKKFLNEFSRDGGIKLTPLFEEKVMSKTLSWDYYKKMSASINFPTSDELAEFKMTKEGSMLGLIDEVGGLKMDITISAPRQKQVLNASQTRDVVKSFLTNDFCSKLVLKGADYETESLEEFDLKNAQIKYSEQVEISGSYMVESEALPILKKAFADQNKSLLHLPE